MLSFLGVLLGLIITSDTLGALADLFGIFSRQTENRLCLFLALTGGIIFSWALLLKNNLKRHQKYLKQYAPSNFNIDAQEEYDEAWDEAEKKEKQV
jgi:hypothetical protein